MEGDVLLRYRRANNINVGDVVITDSGGDGISATSYDTTNAPININIESVTITNPTDQGIYLYGAQANIEDTVISGGTTGINISQNAVVNISDSSISGASDCGLIVSTEISL